MSIDELFFINCLYWRTKMQKDDDNSKKIDKLEGIDVEEERFISSAQLNIVAINLTQQQQDELFKLTGEKVKQLKIGIQDLSDIADLVAN